jgi:hypothetical protein
MPMARPRCGIPSDYRFIKCGLVNIIPEDWLEDAGFRSIDDYFEKLASVDRNKKSSSIVECPDSMN